MTTYADVLDRGLSSALDGGAVRLSFDTSENRDRYRMALYATMRRELERSKKLDPTDPAWGVSAWDGLAVFKDGKLGLKICYPPEPIIEEIEKSA